MSNVLNLNLISEPPLKVTVKDTKVNLKSCTLKVMKKYYQFNNTTTENEIMNFTLEILNNNTDEKVFDSDFVDSLTPAQRDKLLIGYFKWMNDTRNKNPN